MSDYGCPLAYLQNMVDADALPVEVLNAIKEKTKKTKLVFAEYSLSALWKMNKKQSIPMLFSALEEVRDLRQENKKLKKERDFFQVEFHNTLEHQANDAEDYEKQIKELKDKLTEKSTSYLTKCEIDLLKTKKVYALEEEIKKLKDFSNWENHPALKHKVVLDEDFYTAHLDEHSELIPPEERDQLEETKRELEAENYKLTCRINSLHKIHKEFKQILTQE